MTIKPYTNDEWNTLPHAVLTSDAEWDPSVLDCPGGVDEEIWFDAQPSLPEGPTSPTFDEFGDLRHDVLSHEMFYFDAETFDTEAEI